MGIIYLNTEEMKKEVFELEFIKYYPKVQEEHSLSPTDTLTYGLIKTVIEFQKEVGNKPVCFMSSKRMADNIGCKSQSINNSVNKLKDKGLIETRNKFIQDTQTKTRHIYLPGEAPVNTNDKVSEFFETYILVEDNKKTRAILGDWLYNHKKDITWIAETLDEHYGKVGTLLDSGHLREIYSELTNEEDFQNALKRKAESRGKRFCDACKGEYNIHKECLCNLPF